MHRNISESLFRFIWLPILSFLILGNVRIAWAAPFSSVFDFSFNLNPQSDIELSLSRYTLFIALAIGFIASIVTIMYAFQMRGSVVGDILNAFSFGMLLLILSFLTSAIAFSDISIQRIVHDALLIAGYSSMLLGSIRMRKFKV